MRYQQVIHQWQILQALQEGPKTLNELAAVAECCRRNVYRHLEALEYAGFPLFSDVDDDGRKRWRLAGRINLPARTHRPNGVVEQLDRLLQAFPDLAPHFMGQLESIWALSRQDKQTFDQARKGAA